MNALDKKYEQIGETYESIQEWNKSASEWTMKNFGCPVSISYNTNPKIKSWQVYAQHGLTMCLYVCSPEKIEEFIDSPVTSLKKFFTEFNIV